MNINSFNIDTSTMPSSVINRRLRVSGEIGAQFKIFVLESGAQKFYDFKTKEFAVGHNSLNNNLIVTLKSTQYNNNILFPDGAGSYVIKLIAINGTKIQNSKKIVLVKNISKQSSDTTITFTPETANTSSYATFPTTTSVGAVSSGASVAFDWDVVNTSSDANGFGLRLASPLPTITEKYWYTKATTDVNGAISSSTALVVDSIADIGVGTIISSGTGISGTPSVTAIDTATNTLTLSSAQSLSDGVTLTFRALGSTYIKAATGLDISFGRVDVLGTELTKTTRAGSSGTTINLNGTYGIAGGNHVSIFGVGVDNSSANAVTSVSASASAGSIVVQNSQTLLTGITLTFDGCHQTINFSGDVVINEFPSDNKTVYFDIDQLITVGAAS